MVSLTPLLQFVNEKIPYSITPYIEAVQLIRNILLEKFGFIGINLKIFSNFRLRSCKDPDSMVRGSLFAETKILCANIKHTAGRGGQKIYAIVQQSDVQLIAGEAFCPPGCNLT